MKEVGAVNINTHLKGAVVLDANTARKLGNVTDVLINPDKGVAIAHRLAKEISPPMPTSKLSRRRMVWR